MALLDSLKAAQIQLSAPLGRFLLNLVHEFESSHPPQAGDQTFGQTMMNPAGAGQLIGPGSTILFDTPGEGDIPYTQVTGTFRLLPNKKYRLTAHFSLGNYSGETANIAIEWVEHGTNIVLHAGHGALCTSGGNTNSINTQPCADTFHQTFGQVQDVKLRVTSGGATATALAGFCTALVQELE